MFNNFFLSYSEMFILSSKQMLNSFLLLCPTHDVYLMLYLISDVVLKYLMLQ